MNKQNETNVAATMKAADEKKAMAADARKAAAKAKRESVKPSEPIDKNEEKPNELVPQKPSGKDIVKKLKEARVFELDAWIDGMPKAKNLSASAFAKLYVEHANNVFALGLSLDDATGKNFKSLRSIIADGLRSNKRIKKQYTSSSLRKSTKSQFGADFFKYELRALSTDK